VRICLILMETGVLNQLEGEQNEHRSNEASV